MQQIASLWQRGWIGKLVVGTAGLFVILMACCAGLAAFGSTRLRSGNAPTNIPTVQSAVETQNNAAVPVPIATSEPSPVPTPMPTIGQAVTIGKIQWLISEAKDYGNHLERKEKNLSADAKTTGRFIWVHYQITAIDGGSQITRDHIELKDSKGKFYKNAYSGNYMNTNLLQWLPDEEECPGFAMQHTMKKGESMTCQAVFDVPADATGFQVYVTAFGSGDGYINLGL